MNAVVVSAETFFEETRPFAIQLGESLTNVSIEARERALLRTTFDNHVAHLNFLTFWYVKFEQFVCCFFEDGGTHDGQVYGTSKIDQVRLRTILNVYLCLYILAINVRFVRALGIGIGT